MKRIATTLLVAGLMATPMLALPPFANAAISIGVDISVGMPPPPLPVYEQPMIPAPGYIWTPGYWSWDPSFGYYWVPGTWVMPPQVGLLWTPGWWGWSDGYYRWNPGYWGTHVGFYGGVNYGHGYFGSGYSGGYWRGNNFFYNRAVNNINVTNIHNVYVNKTVINNVNVNRVSYNGGRGGLSARPTAQQRTWASQAHVAATSMQTRQRETAMHDPGQRFKVNQGKPAVFATQHAGRFEGAHVVHSANAAKPGNPMTTAPRRPTEAAPAQRANMSATERSPHGMVEAPRNRMQPQSRPESRPSPRNERPVQGQERGMVEAPHNRVQAPRPENRPSPRNEARPEMRQPNFAAPPPRPENARNENRGRPAPRSAPPASHEQRANGHDDKKGHDNSH